jgi:hypothetical protein
MPLIDIPSSVMVLLGVYIAYRHSPGSVNRNTVPLSNPARGRVRSFAELGYKRLHEQPLHDHGADAGL